MLVKIARGTTSPLTMNWGIAPVECLGWTVHRDSIIVATLDDPQGWDVTFTLPDPLVGPGDIPLPGEGTVTVSPAAGEGLYWVSYFVNRNLDPGDELCIRYEAQISVACMKIKLTSTKIS